MKIAKNILHKLSKRRCFTISELHKTWEEYISNLPKKKRHELRKIRRLEENTEYDSGDYSTSNHQG